MNTPVNKGLVFGLRVKSKKQKKKMLQTLGSQRFIWNYFLDLNIKKYKEEKKFIFYNEMASILKAMKKEEETKWLKGIPSQTLQQTLMDLERAIKDGYSNKKGFPKFKSRNKTDDSCRFPQGFKIKEDLVFLPCIKWIRKGFKSRKDVHKRIINHVTLKYDRLKNKFLLSINYVEKITFLPKTKKQVGIDVGSVRLYTSSDGKYRKALRDVPRIKKLLEKLEKEQPKFSNILEKLKPFQWKEPKKKSKKALYFHLLHLKERKKKTVGLIYRKISDSCKNLLHKESRKLVEEYDLIASEDLNLKGMTKSSKGTVENPGKNVKQKSGLNRNMLSNRLGMFLTMIQYKCDFYGKKYVQVPAKNTSRRCFKCGYTDVKNRKVQSKFKCLKCGYKANADYNAACNILCKAQEMLHVA